MPFASLKHESLAEDKVKETGSKLVKKKGTEGIKKKIVGPVEAMPMSAAMLGKAKGGMRRIHFFCNDAYSEV
jgi:hypothetical protein